MTGCTTTPDPACALVGTDQADCEAAGSCTWANRDGEWGCAVTDQDAACEAAATGKDACEAAGATPGDCSWSPEWLRQGFTGYCRGEQLCSYTGMVNSTAVSCGLSAAISAGDFPVQVSLNGQQFHDSSVQFHFTPVIFSLAGPPVGSDTGGSEVLIRGFGLSNVELLDLSQILCKFGDIETVPAASISDNGYAQASLFSGHIDDLTAAS